MERELNRKELTEQKEIARLIKGNIAKIQMSPSGNRPLTEPLPSNLELVKMLRNDPSSYINKISEDAYERILKTYK